MKRSNVRLLVMGGLGNQLFQYATALRAANEIASQVILDYRFLRLFGVKHQVSLTDIPLKELPNVRWDNDKCILLKKVLIKAIRTLNRFPFFNSFCRKYLGVYVSNEIDEELNHGVVPKPRLILGYFQTKKNIEVVKNSIILPIFPKTVSSKFEQEYRTISENEMISIHVRLGDYKSEANTIGNLSESYYLRAQDHFEISHPGSKYLIFTNDPHSLVRDYSELLSRECNAVFNPEIKMSDIEEFSLMSACKGHIIANSTFSYWAAALSKNSKMVIRPSKWFKELTEPKDLFPDHWQSFPSEWI